MPTEIGLRMSKVFQTIEDYISDTGKLPSTTEISNLVNFPKKSVRRCLKLLEEQDKIQIVFKNNGVPSIYMPEYMYQAVIRKQQIPEWAISYKFKKTQEIENLISENEMELSKLRRLEDLLYSTGRILEEAIETAFRLLDLKDLDAPYENSDMWDFSFTLNKITYICDAKGKGSWADKSDIAQLNQWLQKFLDENPREDATKVCGLIIINHFRNLDPKERWPKKPDKHPLSTDAIRYLKLGPKKFLTTLSLYEIAKSIITESKNVKNCLKDLENSLHDSL